MATKGQREKEFKNEMRDLQIKAGMDVIKNIVEDTFRPIKEFSKFMSHFVYIDPVTFIPLLKKYQTVDYEIAKEKVESSGANFVFTNHVKAPEYANMNIELEKGDLDLIKSLDIAFCNRLYSGFSNKPFNKKTGVLIVDGESIKLNPDKEPAKICTLLFGSTQYIKKTRQWAKVKSAVLDHGRVRASDENAIKLKVFRLNKRIYEKTGYPGVISFENKTLFVNPDYYFLFTGLPNSTEQ